MIASLAQLFRAPRSRRAAAARRRPDRDAGAGLAVQQLEQRLALAFTADTVTIKTTPGFESAMIITIDDAVDANGEGRDIYMQHATDGSPYFLVATNPSFINATRISANTTDGSVSTILVTSSSQSATVPNAFFSSNYSVFAPPPAPGNTTSGNFAHSFTFVSSTLIPTQRLIVDLAPAGSSISINSRWDARRGDSIGIAGVTADLTVYQAYGGYLTAGQIALYATNVTISSDVTFRDDSPTPAAPPIISRFTADGANQGSNTAPQRISKFTEPVRNLTLGANVGISPAGTIGGDIRVRLEGTTTTPGLLQISPAATMSATNTLAMMSVGADFRVEGAITSPTQTYVFNPADVTGSAFTADPNTYTFTTRSKATGAQSGTIVAGNMMNMTFGNAAGGTVDVRTDATRIGFTSGLTTRGMPYRYAVNIEETNDLVISSVASSSGPISIKTGSPGSTGNNLTIQGTAVQTAGDLSLTAYGSISLGGSLNASNGTTRVQADSLALSSGVTAGGGKDVALFTNTGDAQVNGLSRAGGQVLRSVRVASERNYALTGVTNIDGVALTAPADNGTRVLLKNQLDPTENGIYAWSAGTLTRATDNDEAAEFVPGFLVYAVEGTQRGGWVFANPVLPNFSGAGNNQTGITFLPATAALTYADARVATTANLPVLGGLLTVDGVGLAAGDRVLVKNQDNAAQNGIYVAQAGAWRRAGDANSPATLVAGGYVFVTGGGQSGTGWVLVNDVVSVGTTLMSFTAFTQQPPTAAAFWAPVNVLAHVHVATTVNIQLSGLQSIDGVLLLGGERVLVKNQMDPATNGVYVASSGTWTRAVDADTAAELPRGTTVYVLNGTQGRGTSWSFDDSVRRMGTTTANSTTLSGLGTTAGLTSGMLVVGDGIPANTTIASIIDGTSVRLSTVATLSRSTSPITFTPLLDTVLGTTPLSFLPTAGDVSIGAARSISGSSRLQGAAALLQAGALAGATAANSTINARTNVGTLTAAAPGAITLDNSTPVELASVSTTTAGPITVTADGTITATRVNAKAVAGTPGNVSLTSVFGDVVARNITSDLGNVTLNSINGSVELPTGGSVITNGSVAVTADNGIVGIRGRIAAQGTGSDVSLNSANGRIDVPATADVSAQDQIKVFAGDPTKPTSVLTSKFTANRLDWTAAGALPSQSTNFKSLKATRTDDGPLVVTAAAAGTFTIEGLNTRNGSISVTASDLLVSGAIFSGDSATPGRDDDVSLTATAGKIILDGSVTASRDVKLSSTDAIGFSAGTIATATATVAGGQVTGLTLTAPGAGYTTAPAVVVSPPQQPGGTRAVYTALVNNGQVTGFQQVVAGSGYTAPPTVTIAPPAVITAPNSVSFNANNSARLNTNTKSLAGTLTGVGATLVVSELDDLALGAVTLPGGGTVTVTTGSGTTPGNLSIDSIDAGAAGDVRIDAFGNVTGVLPAPDIVAGKATIQSTGGRLDLATSIAGPVSLAATLDVVLANSTDLVLNNVTSSNGKVSLQARGGVTQAAGGRIVATSGNGLLEVTATGNVVLDNAGNDVNALAVNNGTGQVSYQDANDFSIGGTGVVTAAATFTSAGGSVTQTAPVVSQSLVVNSPNGAVVLTDPANNVGTVAIQAGKQTVKFVDADDYAVTAPGISGGDVTLSTVALGATVSQTAAINAATVTLTGAGGTFLLDTQPNQTGSFSSDAGSSIVKFRDSAGGLAIGQVNGSGGDVTVTAAGAVTQTGAITTGAFTINGNGSPIQLNTIANDVKTFAAGNGGGIVSFYDAVGGLELAGVTGGSVAFTIIGGPLTQTAPVTASALQVASFGGAAVSLATQDNSIGVFAANASGPVSVKDTTGDLVLAGIDGSDGAPTKVSVEVAGGLYESAPIKAGSLSVKGSGSPIVLDSQKNLVGSFAATNGTGWVSFLDAAGGLDVGGIAAGPVTLAVTGPVTQSGAITATSLSVTGSGSPIQLDTQANVLDSFSAVNKGGWVSLQDTAGDLVLAGVTAGDMAVVAAGSLTQTAPIAVNSLGLSANGPNVRLDNPANLVNVLGGANLGGNVTFVNAGSLAAGPITAGQAGGGNGNLSLTALTGNIAVVGSLTAEQDQIMLDASGGTITFAPGVALNGDILVYYYDPNQPAPVLPGTVPPVVAQNGNLSIVNPAADNTVLLNGYAATGDISIVSDTGFVLSGVLRTTGAGRSVQLVANSGSITFQGNGGIDNAPALGGTTLVKAAAGQVTGTAANVISGGTTTLQAGQGITLPGPINATTLSAAGGGAAVSLAGANTIGSFSAANAGGAVIVKDATGGLVLGAIQGSTVDVTAAGPVTQTGAIAATGLTVTGNGATVSLDTQPNTFGQFAATNAGGTVSTWSTAPSLVLGSINVGSLVVTASGPVTQSAPLNAGGLVVAGAGTAIKLDSQANYVGGVVVTNPGGSFALRTTAPNLVLAGVTAASVTLNAAGSVTQSAPVTATSLAVTGAGGAIALDTQNNVLGSFSTTSGQFAVNVKDTKGDLALGAIQGGAVTVTAAGAVTQTAPITATTLAVTGVGSPINLGTQANVIDTFVATNGTGAVTVRDSVGGLNLGNITSGALTVNAAGNVAVNQTRVVASGPATITTTGGGTLTVTGPQPGGLVSSGGQLNLAGVQGAIALVNGGLVQGQSIVGNNQPIQVGGTISTTAALNAAVSQINTLPTITGSPYEIVVGANLVLTQTLSFNRAVSLRGASSAARLTGSGTVTNGVVLGATAGGSRITNLAFAGFAGTAIQLNAVQNAAVSGVTVTGTGGNSIGVGVAGISTGTTVRGSSFTSLGFGTSIVGATGFVFGGTATGQGNTITSAARAGVFASGVCTGSSVVKTRFVTTGQPYNVGGSRGLTIVN